MKRHFKIFIVLISFVLSCNKITDEPSRNKVIIEEYKVDIIGSWKPVSVSEYDHPDGSQDVIQDIKEGLPLMNDTISFFSDGFCQTQRDDRWQYQILEYDIFVGEIILELWGYAYNITRLDSILILDFCHFFPDGTHEDTCLFTLSINLEKYE